MGFFLVGGVVLWCFFGFFFKKCRLHQCAVLLKDRRRGKARTSNGRR